MPRKRDVLQIRLHGPLEVLRDGETIELPPSKKTRALLGYLVATGREHARTALISLLWDVADDPRGALRWSMSRLRAIVDEPGQTRIRSTQDRVAFDASGAEVDLYMLRRASSDEVPDDALELALASARGELLEGLEQPEFPAYEAWLRAERERARSARKTVAKTLLARAGSDLERATRWAGAVVEADPFDLEARGVLIERLVAAGRLRDADRELELGLRLAHERGLGGAEGLRRSRTRPSPRLEPPASRPTDRPAERSWEAGQIVRFCTTKDGVRLAYATVGAGPAIVKTGNWITHLEHDWVSPVWSHLVRELARYGRLVRYDQRGNGLSDWNAERLDFETMVSDLETVVDAAGLDRFVLYGTSQGCAVSCAYAARHPERVQKLVLHGGYVWGWTHWNQWPLEHAEGLLELIRTGWGQPNPAFRQFFTSRFLPQGNLEQMQWLNELQRITSTGDTAVRLMRSVGVVDVRPWLASVRAPTLVTHVARDGMVPFEQGRALSASIPDARFVSLPSENHLLLENEPAWPIFVEALRSFLAEPG